MKKAKENFIAGLIILGIVSFIAGVGFAKYKLWRAEHPQAQTWTFFIPNGK